MVARRIVRLADSFQISLDTAQIGHAGFQIVQGAQAFGLDFGLVGFAFTALQKPLLLLLERDVCLQCVEALGNFSLFFKLFEVGVQLTQNVFDTGEVLAGVAQAVFGFAAALFVFRDTRSFLQKQAQLLRLGFDDPADRALANDGVRTWPQSSAQEHVLYIASAHGLVVDVVAAGTVAGQHALNGNLWVLSPLATSAVVVIAKHQLHTGTAGWLAGIGTVENHVLHGFTAQLGRLGLTQHPSNRIHDVGFAAAIGADHAHQLAGQHEVGGLGKGLEAGEFDGVKAHGSS